MFRNSPLLFGACNVPLPQFRRSRDSSCPLLHFLRHLTYSVTDRGFCLNGSFQFGICSRRFTFVRLESLKPWRRVMQRVLLLRRECGLSPRTRTPLAQVAARVLRVPPTVPSPEKVATHSVSSPVVLQMVDIPLMKDITIASLPNKMVIKKSSPVKLFSKSN